MTDDRLDRMMADPEAYFAEARQRAREMIERDLEREREAKRWPLSRYWLILATFLGIGAVACALANTWTGDQRWADTAVTLLILGLGAMAGWWFQSDIETTE